MLKKSCLLLFAFILSFSFSICSFALGNDFTFNVNYWNSVLENSSSTFYDSTGLACTNSYGVNTETKYTKVSDTLVDYPIVLTEWSSYSGNGNFTDFAFGIPVYFNIKPGETLNFQFLLAGVPKLNTTIIDSYSFRLRRTNGAFMNLSSVANVLFNKQITNVEIGYLDVVSSPNGDYNNFVSEVTTKGWLLNLTYTNETDSDVAINQIALNLSTTNTYGLKGSRSNGEVIYYGFYASKDNDVPLPSYVESNLIDIGNQLKSANENLVLIQSQINSLLSELEALKESIGDNNSVVNNYYEQVLQGDPEVIERQEQIKEEIISAKQETEEILETLGQVNNFELSTEHIDSVSSSISTNLDNYVSNGDPGSVLSIFFDNSLIMMLLLTVFSLATVRYVLFGKS